MQARWVKDECGRYRRVKGKPRGRPFAAGEDPRRRPLTLTDCRKGYLMATRVARMPSQVRAWLWKKLRSSKIAKARATELALWSQVF